MTVIRMKTVSLLILTLLTVVPAFAEHLDIIGNVSWQKAHGEIEIRAERIANFAPSGTSGFLRLQIWATDEPYDGVSAISGYVLGTFNLGHLNAGTSFINVSAVVRYFKPPPGIYYTTMTLEEEQVDGSFVIEDSENFEEPVNLGKYGAGLIEDLESAGDITFVGDIMWLAGQERVEFLIERVQNERESGKSGKLRVKLWATSTPYNGGLLQGYPMAKKKLGRLPGGTYFSDFYGKNSFNAPPPDAEYYVTMTLEEYVQGKWEIVDFITFPGTSLF